MVQRFHLRVLRLRRQLRRRYELRVLRRHPREQDLHGAGARLDPRSSSHRLTARLRDRTVVGWPMGKRDRNTLVQSALGWGAGLFALFVVGGCAVAPPPIGVDCTAHPVCGAGWSCGAGLECLSISGCSAFLCIPFAQACLETCGELDCGIFASLPARVACSNSAPAPGRPGAALSCQELQAQRLAELATIQSCGGDSECGQPLVGTSCGCTRDLVARADADTTRFYAIESALQEQGCDGFATTCDCPPADGFRCVSGTCSWNYTN